MSYHISPIANSAQIDANGNPLSGGKIYTYLAGTATAAATYADDAGTVQANPIILNASGLPANPIWLLSGIAYKFVFKDASDVLIRTVDDITGVNDVSASADQWLVYAASPTYISATSFSVAGDQTGTFQVSRRLKSVNTGGTIYSTISTSTYGAGITTVVVVNDSGTLDSGLSSVSYGLLSALNNSVPRNITAATATALVTGRTISLTGDVTATTGAFDGTGNVTAAATIPANAITTTKVADGNITAAKLNGNQTGSAPIFGVRAWGVMNLSTGLLLASGNVSGVVVNGTGDFTVTFNTAMPDANYAVSFGTDNSITASPFTFVDTATAKTSSAVRIGTVNGAGTRVNSAYVAFMVLR